MTVLKLTGHRIRTVRLPYRRPVQWVNHAEDGVDLLLLVLETDAGRGVGEAALRLNWTGATARTLPVVLEDIFLPRLQGVDLGDTKAVAQALRVVPEHALAKSVIDTACWDLRAQAAGRPLWRHLGSDSDSVPVSWTLTRAEPRVMAREAEKMRARHGFETFKVKTGQGLETDRAALEAIRAAVGPDLRLYADFNGACELAEVEPATQTLAEFGVEVAEDPCSLSPSSSFRRIKEASAVPILVDGACRSIEQAQLFIDAGAEALSVKVPKSGITESLDIAAAAREAGVSVCVGLGATTSLGAVAALSLASALPSGAIDLPCEEAFYFQFAEEYFTVPLAVAGGRVTLPSSAGLHDLIDWRKVEAVR